MPRTKVVKKKAIEKMSPFAKEAYTMIENMSKLNCYLKLCIIIVF